MGKRGKSSIFFLIPTILLVGAYAISYFSIWVDPEIFWPMGVVGLGFPALFVLFTIFTFYSFFSGKRVRWILFILWLPGFLETSKFYQFSPSEAEEVKGTEIRLMSYNVRAFDRYDWLKTDHVFDKISHLVDSINPDIICFQEFYDTHPESNNSKYKTFINKLGYQYHAAFPKQKSGALRGVVTFSKHPIIQQQAKPNTQVGANGWLSTKIQVHGTELEVVNFHLASYSLEEYRSVSDSSFGEFAPANRFVGKIRKGMVTRSQQVKDIKKHFKETENLILVGDLNDIPHSFAYNQLIKGKEDCFMLAGKGDGKTYTGLPPFVRIDYVLSTPNLQPKYFEVVRVKLSDHYPIFTDFMLQGDLHP